MSDDFADGSIAAANAILSYLGRIGHTGIAERVRVAWDDGSLFEAPAAPKDAPAPTLSRAQARDSGYTGDQCTICNSMRMKRNGSCLVCEACGTTTGCS